MNDFAVDGKPLETPVGAATDLEAMTPPSLTEAFAAQFHEGSTLEPLFRWTQREKAAHPEVVQALGESGQGEFALFYPSHQAPAEPPKMLTAEEANAKYAPVGADGKRAPITEKPMAEGVAQLVGKAKADEIEREGVLARYSNAYSWPVTFATGTAAFMLDPLNLGAAFIPGVGEEAVLARLGTGFAARTTARLVAGATAGAASQIPLTGIKYELGQQEAADYDLRDAFRDIAFAAAGNAVVHAGIGSVGELLPKRARTRQERTAGVAPAGEPGEPSAAPPAQAAEAKEVLEAAAPTKQEALRVAVAQIAEGKPVDVSPVLDEAATHAEREQAQVEQARKDLEALEAAGYRPPTETLPGPRVPSASELTMAAGEPELVPTGTPEGLERLKRETEAKDRQNLMPGETMDEMRARRLAENKARENPASLVVRIRAEDEAPHTPGVRTDELESIEREAYAPKEGAEKQAPGGEEPTPPVTPEHAQRTLALAHEDANLIRLAGRCL